MIGDVYTAIQTVLAAAVTDADPAVSSPVAFYLGADRVEWQDVPPRIVLIPTTMGFNAGSLSGPRKRLDYSVQWGVRCEFEAHIWGVRGNGDTTAYGDFDACERLLDLLLTALRESFTGSVEPSNARWEVPGQDGKEDSDSEFEVGRVLICTVAVDGVLVQPRTRQSVAAVYESTDVAVPGGSTVHDLVDALVGGTPP